jgi:hypothetical protein
MTPTPEQERLREVAGHTPGPWIYTRNPENTRWIIDGAPARAIACTAGYEPNNEANARLIAAAPELLEALTGIIHHMADRKVELERMGSGVPLIELLNTTAQYAAVEAARTAIRKARGE